MMLKQVKRLLIFGCSILLLIALISCGGSGVGDEIKVPVRLENANNVGSLHIELVYDTAILQADDIKAGELVKNSLFESSLETPGRVVVSIIDVAGINGDGTVIETSFTIVGEGTSELTLENIEAYDASTMYDIIIECSPGNVEGNMVSAPVVLCRD
jgi:hypothetical protein